MNATFYDERVKAVESAIDSTHVWLDFGDLMQATGLTEHVLRVTLAVMYLERKVAVNAPSDGSISFNVVTFDNLSESMFAKPHHHVNDWMWHEAI